MKNYLEILMKSKKYTDEAKEITDKLVKLLEETI